MYDKPIQHGELTLDPTSEPGLGTWTERKTVDEYIGSKSNQGHHHVLKSPGMTIWFTATGTVVKVAEEGTITQLKETDKHPDLPLPVGVYRINIKTEYDIFDDVIREVQD